MRVLFRNLRQSNVNARNMRQLNGNLKAQNLQLSRKIDYLTSETSEMSVLFRNLRQSNDNARNMRAQNLQLSRKIDDLTSETSILVWFNSFAIALLIVKLS